MPHAFASTLQTFPMPSGREGRFYSVPALAQTYPSIHRLPITLRIVLESVLRHCDGLKITPEQVVQLAQWQAQATERTQEIAMVVARVVLQDFTGVPLLTDLAAMRSVAQRLGRDPARIVPLVPVDLVVDHSVMVDVYGQKNALDLNMQIEFSRNRERYSFLKWGMQAFDQFGVVPPGFGIVHQVNLEYLARGVYCTAGLATQKDVYYPDTLVGTDSHTTMINGIGVVGWGVGGIEAEAAMLGQPVYFLTPDVVGVELTGQLREGVTATDLVLSITQLLRQTGVVGKFVEFFGEGTRTLSVPDRATIANMAPEYGATMGFFPVDAQTIAYFHSTGRTTQEIEALEAYCKAQGWFGTPLRGDIDYSSVLQVDLGSITPSVSGPKRPQDRIELGEVAAQFESLFSQADTEIGFNQPPAKLRQHFAVARTAPEELDSSVVVAPLEIRNGDVLIAAITSCTNTSNPSVMLAAGLLAKKAVLAGLRVAPHIKTSLAPGSRTVTAYLQATGLLPYLEQLGFSLVGYGCTTCIGNSGDLSPALNAAILEHDLVCASVLSGNRNFEARIHPNLKANFLASPPLVVAYAIAGTMLCNLMRAPLGQGAGADGVLRDVYLGDIWPSAQEINDLLPLAMQGPNFRNNYAKIKTAPGALWEKIPSIRGKVYPWPASSYIAEPPFLRSFSLNPSPSHNRTGTGSGSSSGSGTGKSSKSPARSALATAKGRTQATQSSQPSPPQALQPLELPELTESREPRESPQSSQPTWQILQDAKILALFSNSLTTDHISPAGAIEEDSPAGQWLRAQGVLPPDFNSYGARRGHYEVMCRATFANVRIKNWMLPPLPNGGREEGGNTLYQGPQGTGQKLSIFEAAMRYQAEGLASVVFAGEEYGTGSSRDWAAKGTLLLGVKAVIAQSFERIHRSNLVGMGVLPLQFKAPDSWQSLGLDGTESIGISVDPAFKPQSDALLSITRRDGRQSEHRLLLRIDTPIEVAYFQAGGILPFVLRQLLV